MSVSGLNQAVSSGTNFILSLYLVRVLTPAEFGIFGIGFAVCYLYSGFGNALFLTQMVVHMPDRFGANKKRYAERILFLLVAFVLASIFISTVVFLIANKYFGSYFLYFISVSILSATYLLKDFFIRYSYVFRNEKNALLLNVSIAVAMAIMYFLLCTAGSKLTASTAIFVCSAAYFISAILGFYIHKVSILKIQKDLLLSDFKESISGGKWAVGGVSLTWIQSQAYMYITVVFFGPAQVGMINAARMLVSPFMFLIPAINQVVLPRLAEKRNDGASAVVDYGAKFTKIMVFLSVVYSAVVILNIDFLVKIFTGNKYIGINSIVIAWCLFLVAQIFRDGASSLMQVFRHFKYLTLASGVSAPITLFLVLILLKIFSLQGAVSALAIGELILALFLWKRIRSNG